MLSKDHYDEMFDIYTGEQGGVKIDRVLSSAWYYISFKPKAEYYPVYDEYGLYVGMYFDGQWIDADSVCPKAMREAIVYG